MVVKYTISNLFVNKKSATVALHDTGSTFHLLRAENSRMVQGNG